MVDYNQALSVDEALERGRALQREGVAWLEEPIRHDDHRGNAAIARALDLPLQIGENFNGPQGDGSRRSTPRACDLVMPDVGAHRRRHRLDAGRRHRRRARHRR